MNLLNRDIVNLPLARELRAECLLVADIDRGDVFASLVRTHALCTEEDRRRIRGFIINKFRGQESLFQEGVDVLKSRTGWPCLGIIPRQYWLRLEEKDSVALESKVLSPSSSDTFNVCVVRLPHLSNYTDFDPLEQSNVRLVYAASAHQLRGGDLIILPGTKNTVEDLIWLRRQGFEEEIRRAVRSGVSLLGICGGFQMLGQMVREHGCLLD